MDRYIQNGILPLEIIPKTHCSDNLPYEKVGNNEPVCIADDVPFDIPKSWELIRLNDIGIYRKGPFGSALTKSMFVNKGIDTIKVYEQKNAIKKDHTLGDYYITKKYYEEKMKSFSVKPGDIIVSCAGTIGETYVLPENIEQGIINQALMRMEIFAPISIDYFLLYFDYVLKESAKANSKGSAIKNIPPFDIFKKLLLPLPPLQEQVRIVQKTKKLQPFIERYNEVYLSANSLNASFPEMLKKSILQQSVQGKLIPQDPNDEPASVLLERIRAEKQKLIAEGKIKKDKHESVIFRRDNSYYEKRGAEEVSIDDELPFEIPRSWQWCYLKDVAFVTKLAGFEYTKYIAPNLNDTGIPLFKGKNVQNGKLVLNFEGYIPERLSDELSRSQINKKCLLTPYVGTIGNIAIFDGDFKAHLGSNVGKIELVNPVGLTYLSEEYVLNYLRSPAGYQQLTKHKKATAQESISIDAIRNVIIPIPPTNEQNRIINILAELERKM